MQIENWLIQVITVTIQSIDPGFYICGKGFGFKGLLYLINFFAGLIVLHKIYSMDGEADLLCQTKVII